ncbi:MAG: 4-hydroxythreonine-4-phosphate dehydrogenase PdxA [Candidatus Schekmanbacteria bacterium]|nr:4-hydroxythreonine-4-phosphate dehydrogenase PdxA [Candidatus Schekmanbacteria bacterium]
MTARRPAQKPLLPTHREPAAPALALCAGDPAGIGPEIVIKALSRPDVDGRGIVVIGHEPTLVHRCGELAERGALSGPPVRFVAMAERDLTVESATAALGPGEVLLLSAGSAGIPAPVPAGSPSDATGAAALRYLEVATQLVLTHRLEGMVTAPVSKYWTSRAGAPFRGHTEFLAAAARKRHVVMTMVGGGLRIGVLTTHYPLRAVPGRVTRQAILRALKIVHASSYVFADTGGRARIAVCGLNPHAGEGGLLGTEEERVVGPAVADAAAAGIDATGPHSADSVFRRALDGEFDYVLALYHDQGMIPVKLLTRNGGVNVTLGLPFVRTSVDHWTGFDIAASFKARAESLVLALRLAGAYCRARRVRPGRRRTAPAEE